MTVARMRLSSKVRCGVPLFGIVAVTVACDREPAGDPLLGHCPGEPARSVVEFTLREEWTVGGFEDEALSLTPPIVFPAPAPRGGLSLARRFEAPILTLNADGTVRSEIGRAGTGPGEWPPHGPAGIAWYGDTLWVVEMSPPRVHRFFDNGDLIDTRRIRLASEDRTWPQHVLRNGTVLGALPARIQGGTRRYAAWTPESGRIDSFGLFQRDFTYRVTFPGGGFAIAMRPVHDELLVAAAPDGRSFVVVDRPAAADGDSAWFRIRRIGEEGEDLVDLSVCYVPIPITERERADTIARQAAGFMSSQPGVPAGLVETVVREALPLPPFWPPVNRVIVSTTGDIWIQREIREDGSAPWEIRDQAGRLTGYVVLPAEVGILAVDEEVVWSERNDPWDVPLISRNRLVPAR